MCMESTMNKINRVDTSIFHYKINPITTRQDRHDIDDREVKARYQAYTGSNLALITYWNLSAQRIDRHQVRQQLIGSFFFTTRVKHTIVTKKIEKTCQTSHIAHPGRAPEGKTTAKSGLRSSSLSIQPTARVGRHPCGQIESKGRRPQVADSPLKTSL